jgi:hypothetical protein
MLCIVFKHVAVVMLCVIMLSVIMLSVIMLSVIMLSVVMLTMKQHSLSKTIVPIEDSSEKAKRTFKIYNLIIKIVKRLKVSTVLKAFSFINIKKIN